MGEKNHQDVHNVIDLLIKYHLEQIKSYSDKNDLEVSKQRQIYVSAFWDIYRFAKCYLSEEEMKNYDMMFSDIFGKPERP